MSEVIRNRASRPCDDCNCSPGLLSRQNKRSSLFLKKYNNVLRRRFSQNGVVAASNESIYSSDTLCKNFKEVNTSNRLLALRREMINNGLCCYIIPSEDEHQSEYVSEKDERRCFVSGFAGSAGVACVTRDLLNFNEKDQPTGKSILSTDGRYFNQAMQELDFNWSLLRQGEDKLSWTQWCINEAIEMLKGLGPQSEKVPLKIGIDPRLISYEQRTSFKSTIRTMLSEADFLSSENDNDDPDSFIQFVPVEENLIDKIWPQFEPVPELTGHELYLLDREYHGEEFSSKRQRVLKELVKTQPITSKKSNATTNYFVTVALDEICWLTNLRGSDINYNPVFYAYLIINDQTTETLLFTDAPYNDAITTYFKENEITVKPYREFWTHLSQLRADTTTKKTITIPDTASWQLVRKVCGLQRTIHSPIDLLKSIKNTTEIDNARRAQVKDAICIIQFFAWLEDRLIKNEALVDEYNAAQKLTEIRKTQKNFIGNSFETISSTGFNAAIIHYSPPSQNSAMIDPAKIYLCDSGSQFLEGTTDITRTIHLTKPTRDQIHNYTLVLKGNLALENLVFPRGVNGYQIDCVARQHLWAAHRDYPHGTGHGIGSHLNVHEGPIGIGIRPHLANHPLQPGNIISNEPGYYCDGNYGIRLENDILVTEAPSLAADPTPSHTSQAAATPRSTNKKQFLQFENITLVPYCRKLIDPALLTASERAQINAYHSKIYHLVIQQLQPQSIAFKWLKRETAPL